MFSLIISYSFVTRNSCEIQLGLFFFFPSCGIGFSWQLGLLEASGCPGSCAWHFGGEFRRHTQVELSTGMLTRGGLRGVRLLCATSFPETGDFQRKEVEGAGLTDVGPMSLLRSAKKSWL